MQITPKLSSSNSVQSTQPDQAVPVQQKRTIVMKTQASPEQHEVDGNVERPISDASGQTNEATEATTQPLSPQLAAIAKQRRALQVKERELAAREKALTTQPAGTAGFIDPAQFKAKPLRTMLDNGISYEQLTQEILASQGNQEMNDLKAEIQALKQGLDQKFTDRDTQSKQAVLAEMRKTAIPLVQTGDTYEMVRATNSLNEVMRLIESTYDTTGEVLEVEEALQLVEDELVNDVLKVAKTKKVMGRLNVQTPSQPPQKQQPTGMRTLTNRDNARVQQSRKARAMAAFHGTLRK